IIALYYLGELGELSRRVPAQLREADERGNRYAATTLRTTLAASIWLTAGEPERGREELQRARHDWSRQGFHLEHYWSLFTEGQLDLYQDLGQAAHARTLEAWPALKRSLLLRIQVVRVEALHLRARAQLACAHKGDARRRLIAGARADARAIAGEAM